MKRKTIALLLLLLCVLNVNAQDDNVRTKSVYVEAFGPSNSIGITYDARFNENSRWGYRVGFGFGYTSSTSIFMAKRLRRGYYCTFRAELFSGRKEAQLGTWCGFERRILQ